MYFAQDSILTDNHFAKQSKAKTLALLAGLGKVFSHSLHSNTLLLWSCLSGSLYRIKLEFGLRFQDGLKQ